MLEHVGKKLHVFFNKAYQLLDPGGLFLLQGGLSKINRSHFRHGLAERIGMGGSALIHKYFFPDSGLATLPEILRAAELAGFEMMDAKSFTDHYPLTLARWIQNIENNKKAIVELVGEDSYRCWRLLMSGYLFQIQHARLSEIQFVFKKIHKKT
jgi:cyclopropane-fatty-acyl-phospholipid synthase